MRQLHCDRDPPQCRGMLNFTDLASVPADSLAPFTDRARLTVAAYLARFTGVSRNRTNPTCAATCPGAPSGAWTRWPRSGRTGSCTSGGCRRSAGSSPPPSPAGSRSGAAGMRQGHQGGPDPPAACGRPGHRPGRVGLRDRGRSCLTLVAAGWTGTRPPAACATSPRQPTSRSPGCADRASRCGTTGPQQPAGARAGGWQAVAISAIGLPAVLCGAVPQSAVRGQAPGLRPTPP